MKSFIVTISCIICTTIIFAQDIDIQKKLIPFDKEMEQALKDWNIPGVGVGVVKNGKLVFMKGYGYRDYEKKLPITANTLFQIASNTKLFTSTAAGFLVSEGKLEWDNPIKNYVPSIQFYTNELNNTVTLRDMLSHRTGISRHDMIWHKSNFTRAELFEKLKYLEPTQPIRQGFLYNNLMYAAVGHMINLIEGKPWETYVQEKILLPLDMKSTCFSIDDMKKQLDYFVPYNERRDTTLLYQSKYAEDIKSAGPCGAVVSNINDLSHWLAAFMNKGKYNGKQVIPESIVNATIEPSIAEHNDYLDQGYTEFLNPVYGMGRESISYRGHQMIMHGGDLNGIHSQISFMPQDSIGVIVFVIGNHSLSYNPISFNIYEHLLGMSITPWSERGLINRNASKKMGKEGRAKSLSGQIKYTKPSHPIADYLGDYSNIAYGNINIAMKDTQMLFSLNNVHLPLNHFHYDRFDTKNDEEEGYYSLNFRPSSQGDIESIAVGIDEGESIFIKKPDATLSLVETLTKFTGTYYAGTRPVKIVLKNKNHLIVEGEPDLELIPYKTNLFKTKEYADLLFEFVVENGIVKSVKQKDGTGEYEIKKGKE